ncbi:hypothetical protein L207DRAFT_515483 [Hyaloscypha variabilis F]|uniref:Uncharacterized protein n=1 Tax=Hyaloscypha variabilis (strain UAMH 11265 / GT02V1 / F) TaxID=1149755 RepID=A0A2J6REX2_HYAVF|nr:hypothetical protein L207DRAFT_515483 [Hyaloscypha variabilis F]
MSHSFYLRSEGPYPSTIAGLGGIPTITTDVTICAVFILFYIGFAVRNRIIYQTNNRNRHKFIPSLLLFIFCMSRISTLVLRIAWATRQDNPRLAIAAGIFVNTGVLLVYIINLILAQRMLRAKQPHLGWHPVMRIAYKILYTALAATLIMVIASIVITDYTLDTKTRLICRDVEVAAITFLLFFTCLPIIHIAIALLMSKSKAEETFGVGSTRGKIIVLSLSAGLCMLDAGFKTGTTWSPPRPLADPAWHESKACFYIFDFCLEILMLNTLTFGRIDQRFWIPDGCRKARDYTRLRPQILLAEEASDSYLMVPK